MLKSVFALLLMQVNVDMSLTKFIPSRPQGIGRIEYSSDITKSREMFKRHML